MNDVLDRLTTALADRYTIERELGQGGMATVYLARDIKHDRDVAIKVLRPELAVVIGAERFLREIKTIATLQHPHILPLFDSGEADGFLYYVMPFVDGETLRARLDRETQLGVPDAVRIATDVAEALHYAHGRGVVHRDIKPENILLANGRPMVVDFGIALAVSAAASGRMTETGLSLGTPRYMSPEQATAEKEIGGRSDIYSLATVLYEMLTGEPPHMGNSAQQIIMKIIAEPAQPVTRLRKAVPASVAAAVAKSLEKLPADRFATAKEFADALGNSGFSYEHGGGSPAATGVGDWRMRVAMPAIAVAALLATALGSQLVTADLPALGARYEVAWTDRGSIQAMIGVSPDGQRLAMAGQDGSLRRLVVRHRDQLDAVPIPGTENGVNPAFSPDGNRVVFLVDETLRIANIDGGPVQLVTDSLVGVPGLAWGSDGYIYFDRRGVGPLLRVRETGGAPEAVSTLDAATGELQHVWPDVLPNGRGVIMVLNRGGPGRGAQETDGIAVLDLKTGKHRELFRGVYARYAASGHLLYVTHAGELMGVPFDEDRLTITGPAVALATGIAISSIGTGAVDLTISRNGVLWYASREPNAVRDDAVWSGRDGVLVPYQPPLTGTIAAIALSPDQTRLAYIVQDGASGRAFVTGLAGATRDRLTFDRSFESVTWRPDGRELLVNELRGEAFSIPADGRALPARVPGLPRDVQDIRWSPDGVWLVFSAQAGVNADIFGFRPGIDTAVVPLVTSPEVDRNPSVSPDGRWLLFHTTRGGVGEVYVRPFPNTSGAVRQVSSANGRQPRWSREGREIIYRTFADSLVAVPVLPGDAFAVGEEETLFAVTGVTSWDVTADGQRFLLVKERSSASPRRLNVVENYFEDLRRRVPK
ncbi:MAG: protein kinase [Gemmatimonadota bacterium]